MKARLHSACCVIAIVAAINVAPKHARAADPKPDRVTSPFWSEASAPGTTRANVLLEQARLELSAALEALPVGWENACRQVTALATPLDLPGFSHKRSRVMATMLNESLRRLTHVENAIERLQQATLLAPHNPEVLHALGIALQEWERPGPLWSCDTQRRDAEAIEVLERLRRTHPTHQPANVAFELAILYTRTLQFDRAAQCYAEGAPLELSSRVRAMTLGNWAEVTMLAGDLVGAVRLYERAIETATGAREYLLPLWGLVVALDRLGERESALEQAARALAADSMGMSVLHSSGVFFEPESEIHYYEALGHEAWSRLLPNDKQEALKHAVASWRAFFATGGEQTRWADSARDNLRHVEAELAALLSPVEAPKKTRRATSANRR